MRQYKKYWRFIHDKETYANHAGMLPDPYPGNGSHFSVQSASQFSDLDWANSPVPSLPHFDDEVYDAGQARPLNVPLI